MPLNYYFGGNDFSKYRYQDKISENWQEFFGRLSSLSPAPDQSHARYTKYKQAAEGIFQMYEVDGRLSINIATELHLGRMAVG
jgi:hypothetical protein